MRIVWSADSPAAAKTMIRRIAETVETLLPQNPEIGRQGRTPRTRELVIARTPFVVAYRLHDQTIEVLRVLHGARRWPDRL